MFLLLGFVLLASGVLPGPAHARDAGRWAVLCQWVDPYDSAAYQAKKEPGMAIIAAPRSRLIVAPVREGGTDSPDIQTAALGHSAEFAQWGGRLAGRTSRPNGYVIDLPDTGGVFPLSVGCRLGRNGGGSAETLPLVIIIPQKLRIVRGRINGYVMGTYPERDDDRRAPDRFVEITPDMMDLHISRNFRVGDFVSSSRSDAQVRHFPKYAVIRHSLINKVERLVDLIDRSPHFQCKGIRVLSGFRTPDYNRFLPEAAFHSYHQYGLAADIIVDSAPADGVFDDVNQDRKSNIYDAATLAGICDQLEQRGALPIGGIGLYEHQHSAGKGKWYSTFHVHVDVRESKKTRWGYAFRNGRRYARLVWR
ncbi:MAG: hypothetical protein A3G34_07460 [Candidatus Lindowbacteria bacterium RIFCSPLOWO2_12_FULL_62_27]|nr:MAG: hypothetical protein A3G34_07460 [Candidatus Lindowbacteria bacterium RIFCSPLOWO2_12_FULL_62_27]